MITEQLFEKLSTFCLIARVNIGLTKKVHISYFVDNLILYNIVRNILCLNK